MKLYHIKFFSILLSLLAFSSCKTEKRKVNEDSSNFSIGFAKVNYTPRVGLAMVGNYRGDDYASRGVHDSLYAKAIVAVGTNNIKTAILSVDICLISSNTVKVLRKYVEDHSDIKGDNIMIHATHTHSGPPSELNEPEAKNYMRKAADAVILANKNLKRSKLMVGRTNEDRVSHNRRLEAVDGTTHMVWEKFEPNFIKKPLGSIDPEMITVSIVQEGKTVASIVNFGCHATTLTGNNWLYTADYPGYMTESVQKARGKDFGVLFLNAPSGNVTQVDYKVGFIDTFQECQRIGYILGANVLEGMRKSKEIITSNETVAVSKEMVPLKKIAISEEQYKWANEVLEKVKREGMPPIQADGIPDAEYAQRWVEMYKIQNKVDSLEVMVTRIGELAIVALPGEIFQEFGKDIKLNSPFKNTLVVGLTNGEAGYFPTKVSFTQGPKGGFKPYATGYETTPGTTSYEIGAGEKLAESAIKQLKKLHDKL